MIPIERHRLVRPTALAWQHLIERANDEEARDCLTHAGRHDWPLVITRQPVLPTERVALGLPAPLRWNRRRFALEAAAGQLSLHRGFPSLREVAAMFDRTLRAAVETLADALERTGSPARVHGSHGWQWLTGMDYLHDASDLDLLLPVVDASGADQVCSILGTARPVGRRLDGELLFSDGAAIAWREWCAESSQLLVKRTGGAALESRDRFLERSPC